MRRKFLGCISAMLAVMLITAGSSLAATIEYKFTFTGADLLNRAFVDGVDGSSAVDNNLYDGARLLRVGTNPGHVDAGRTYVQSQHDEFENRWNAYSNADYFLYNVGLWGWDGNGANWGEDFKPTEWITHTGLNNASPWTTSMLTWPWGTPPDGTITDQRPDWDANYDASKPANYNGIYLNNPDSWSDFVFTTHLKIDTEDAWWGQNVGNAPNDLYTPEFTIWFGSYIYGYIDTDNDGEKDTWDGHLYEGNIVLSGTKIEVVPEPATMLLFGVGLLGIAGVSRRKRS